MPLSSVYLQIPNITILQVGSIIVYEPGTEIYSYSSDPDKPIKESVEEFTNTKTQLYGGTGFLAGTKKVTI